MLEKNLEHHDQAQVLREYKEDTEMDVLELPPRKEVHQSSSKKTKWNVNLIWIRFLFVLLLIIIALFLSYPYWDVWFK